MPGPWPGTESRAPTHRPAAPRPPSPDSALSLQTPASRRIPGAAGRGSAAQSALTWKCSAIFPGGGAGQRPERPRGGSVGVRHQSPSRPRGPCAARSLVASASRPSRSKLLTGRGRQGGASAGGRARRGGDRGQESKLPPPAPRSRFNGRCLRWVVMSDLCPLTQPPPRNCRPRVQTTSPTDSI